jgi:hypothetical protein
MRSAVRRANAPTLNAPLPGDHPYARASLPKNGRWRRNQIPDAAPVLPVTATPSGTSRRPTILLAARVGCCGARQGTEHKERRRDRSGIGHLPAPPPSSLLSGRPLWSTWVAGARREAGGPDATASRNTGTAGARQVPAVTNWGEDGDSAAQEERGG